MGKKKGVVTAAGAVVLRGTADHREVLVVRRPAYKDWSLPKGKCKCDEDLPATAVREVYEETGVRISLGLPVARTRYVVDKHPKRVDWWVGHVRSTRRRRPDAEVEKAVWMDVDKAMSKLSYDDERNVLATALELQSSGAVLVVRHAKAMLRKHWSGVDAKRPLNGRGRRQAKRLPELLAAFGAQELYSSTSTRCLQTLEPFSDSSGLPLSRVGLLSEEEAEGNGDRVQQLMTQYARRAGESAEVLAVCGHRPVLPDMREGLGVVDHAMLTAEVLVVHVDDQGRPIATETHKSAF